MYLFILLVFSIGLSISSGDAQCHVSDRHKCRNLFTATECGDFTKCLDLWKTSKWGSVKTDASPQCQLCVHLSGQHFNASMNRLCENPFRSTIQYNKCLDFLSLWGSGTLKNIDGFAFCNILDWCDSHKYIGALNFGSPICEDCKKVVQDVRNLVADNATAAAISDKLNTLICDPLPKQFRDYCKETVKVHVPVVLHLIEAQIVPQDICALLDLCPQTVPFNVAIGDLVPADLVLASKVGLAVPVTHTDCKEKELFSWINRPSSTGHAFWTSLNNAFSSSVEKPTLQECVAVLEQIRQSLNDKDMKEKIKREIEEKVCATLPSFLRSACTAALNVHFDEIMEGLNQANLAEICATFGMRDTSVTDVQSSGQQQALLKPGLPLPGVCQLCEIVVNRLMNLILHNSTEASIAQALETVCSLLPVHYQSECDSLVEQYGAKIINAIIEGTAPKLICYSIGLCGPILTTPTVVEPHSQPAFLRGALGFGYCDGCKLFVTFVQQQFTNNQTRSQIERLVDGLCKVLPASYADECVNLVQQYLPMVLDYVAMDMPPEQICREIGLCANQMNVVDPMVQVDVMASQVCSSNDLEQICQSMELAIKCNKAKECLTCRFMKFIVDSTQPLSAQTTQDCRVCNQLLYRWRLFKKLNVPSCIKNEECTSFTKQQDREECSQIVIRRSEILPELYGSTVKEEDVCKKLQLCRINPPLKLDLPDSSVDAVTTACRDPLFWCASKRNAQLCGREKFCDYFLAFRNGHRNVKDIFGMDPCKWGSAYYCQSEERARDCGEAAFKHCRDHVWGEQNPMSRTESRPLIENQCTFDPVRVCANEETAKACGPQAVERCRQLAMSKILSSA